MLSSIVRPFCPGISNTQATIHPKIEMHFRIDQGTDLNTLAKHIEQQLKKREFCVVFEDEIERCWPSKKLKFGERETQIQIFAESRGWSASILDSASGSHKGSIPVLKIEGLHLLGCGLCWSVGSRRQTEFFLRSSRQRSV